MRKVVILFFALVFQKNYSQELFVVTDPASNIPANTLSARVMQSVFKEQVETGYNYHAMPEISYGISKNLMVRSTVFLSTRSNNIIAEGASFYAKYRVFSTDDVNSHFRVATFGRYSFNKADIHQDEIEIMGHNTGFETGIIATQLIKKVAVSSSVSFEKVFDNKPDYVFPSNQGNNATNYTFSIGKLMYPKKYTSYKQTNINLMLEFLGQTINLNGKSYLDVVPSVQFIINSQARIDIGYRQELYNSMARSAPNGVYFNLEYNFFNVIK
jgi:hypothetical protein